jgi:RNA polymerase-binding transcription factor DksA
VTSRTAAAFNAGLPRQVLAALRARLLEQRAFRREQLRTIRLSAPKGSVGADRAAQAEVQDHLAGAARIVLADVEAALDRMDTGHYGRCIRCRRPVELHRLRICPQTVYCGECHRVREAGA